MTAARAMADGTVQATEQTTNATSAVVRDAGERAKRAASGATKRAASGATKRAPKRATPRATSTPRRTPRKKSGRRRSG